MGNINSDNYNETDSDEESWIVSEIELNQDEDDVMSIDHINTSYDIIVKDLSIRSKLTNQLCLYLDESFPPKQISLRKENDATNISDYWHQIEWKRPNILYENPTLIRDGLNSEDIVQGYLGDCWFLSAVASISRISNRMAKIVPSPQPCYGQPNYTGAFHFRFWQFGEWVDVVVDDNLPTIDGRLCFASSPDSNELWISLLEKAYAKIFGSYYAIEGGYTADALEDLTGGMSVRYNLGSKTPLNLKRILSKALKNDTFVCTGTGNNNVSEKLTGLLSSHAYSVLKFVQVKQIDGVVNNLVKIRNSWGQNEWEKLFSDKSNVWDLITNEDKTRLEYNDEDDNEWWMKYEDFIHHFSEVTVCTVGPDFNKEGVTATGDKWLMTSVKSGWKGTRTGGCWDDLLSYSQNPQYRLSLLEADDFDEIEDDESSAGKCGVVIGLMQKDRRGTKLKNLPIALNVYKLDKVKDPGKVQESSFFYQQQPICGTGKHRCLREVNITAELLVGDYLIVPSNFMQGQEGDFLIRIYTEKNIFLTELVN